jgi:dTDP-4-dehydrorhamnose reductase
MKILLTGSSGLVGHAVAEAAVRRGHAVTALYHENPPPASGLAETRQLDLADTDALTRLCLDLWPDAVVNAAAISEPAAVDAEPEAAQILNVALPRNLAQISTHLGSRLVHISTDMVFDGEMGDYTSTDLPLPRGLYGQQKLMAEREILEHNPEDPVVLRITIVNGNSPGGSRSVHEKLLHALAGGHRPRLFSDEIRQPVSAGNVAEAIVELCERRNLHGIFHWAGREEVDRLSLGRAILRHFRLPEDWVEPARIEGNSDFADRPRKLTLSLAPLLGKLRTQPEDLESQLADLVVPPALIPWHRQHRLPA